MLRLRSYRYNCTQFRSYIIAAVYFERDPAKCVDIMERLCKESNSNSFSFMLFRGRVALYEIDKNITGLRSALSQFLDKIDDTGSENMPPLWVAAVLDIYQKLEDHLGIDDLGITDLIDELGEVLPSERSMSQLIQVINEEPQRSTIQLSKHYNQIISKEFEEYVEIVSQRLLPHEFLKEMILEVARELLLRKKNLQLHSEDLTGKTNTKITKEDLINDWFTSLFDKRMADAGISLRDQKGGGKSASGKSPGEIDGYITDSNSKRISILEAFRLFPLDSTIILEHLNKISGYDNESLSPISLSHTVMSVIFAH